MTIITYPRTDYRSDSYASMLQIGEEYENLFVQTLRDAGIDAGRYHQDLSMLSKYDKRFAMYQRDCWYIDPRSGKRRNVEVKSRNNPFSYSDSLVGKVSSWDAKRFPVWLVAIINQINGDIRVGKADKDSRTRDWLKVTKNDFCYSVPLKYLAPVDMLIEQLKS